MKTAAAYTDVIRSLINLIQIAGKFRLVDQTSKKERMDITDEDIRKLLQSLNRHEVKYLLVGGFAVNIHGYYRTTNDIDLWIKEEDENLERLIRALQENDIPGAEHLRGNRLVPGFTELTFGQKKFKIDLMNFLQAFSAMDFDPAYERSELAEFAGVIFRVIHKQDLITEKKAAGRHKDLDDLEHLDR